MMVQPLKGLASLDAMKGLSALLLGYFMLALPEKKDCNSFEEFFESFRDKTESEKEKIIRTALLFVKIERLEVEAMAGFVKDRNGAAYSAPSLKNMPLNEIIEIVVAVCMEMGKIKITLISEDEKKKSDPSQLTSEGNS